MIMITVRSLEKTEKIREEIKYAASKHQLMLGHCGLQSFPIKVFSSNAASSIIRLDISHNNLREVPDLSPLQALRELWLQHNPILSFPDNIHLVKTLELIDIRHTKVNDVPKEVALLGKLYELDWRGTPLADVLLQKYQIQPSDFVSLRELLIDLNTRKQLEMSLFEFLQAEQFLMDADGTPDLDGLIYKLVEEISDCFDDLLDLKQYVRRAGKFLPEKIALVQFGGVTALRSKVLFFEFKKETDRKRMAADVEIKLRGMYFDRIERSTVTTLLDSIYEYVASLEDIQFLVQYAPQVLPSDVQQASGAAIYDNILALQTDLTIKRKAAIASLAKALGQLYPEQKPEAVQERAAEVAALFQTERFATKKELTKMSQLTAECAKVFPPDFANIECDEILASAQTIIFQNS